MVDGLYFKNSEIYGKIKIQKDNESQIVEALADTGAFKTLIPESICNSMNLIHVDTKTIWGICPTSVRVKIYIADIYFMDSKVINSVIGFDIPSRRQISLIGRDILSQFDFSFNYSNKICELRRY